MNFNFSIVFGLKEEKVFLNLDIIYKIMFLELDIIIYLKFILDIFLRIVKLLGKNWYDVKI